MTETTHLIVRIQEYQVRYETFLNPELNKLLFSIVKKLSSIEHNRQLALELVNDIQKLHGFEIST